MAFWRLKDYWSEAGVNLIQAWYDEQEDEVQSEFDYALGMLTETRDWEATGELNPLKGQYTGLHEIIIDVKVPYQKKKKHYRCIGIWRPDSRDFIMLLGCEKTGRTYNPSLQTAMDYKADWEGGKGRIDDHIF